MTLSCDKTTAEKGHKTFDGCPFKKEIERWPFAAQAGFIFQTGSYQYKARIEPITVKRLFPKAEDEKDEAEAATAGKAEPRPRPSQGQLQLCREEDDKV